MPNYIVPETPQFPRFETPNGISTIDYLRQLCTDGMQKLYGEPSEAVRKRCEYELMVIEQTGFADYFLVCWDIFKFVNAEKILSVVRGSAAASLVLYLLEVTTIDPLKYQLVFERFLNLERREMPDIDMDFQDDRRGEVIEYCTKKYGAAHVAQIITFSRLGARAAVRDTARVMGLNTQKTDILAKSLGDRYNITLEDALKDSQELRDLMEGDKTHKKVVERANQIQGAVRHASTHAAGVVISDKPLIDLVPLQPSLSNEADAPPTTQFDMNAVAKIGLLKMDFLGLRNLSVLVHAAALVRQRTGAEKFDINQVPLTDAKTFKMLSEGDTYGVFQLESDGMRRYILELKPNSISDLAAMIALYRPGPMEFIGNFIESKHGRREVSYLHENLKNILEETYGVIVYQDQILLIAQEFANYTLGQADILRKAMGKKKPEVMMKERSNFVAGAAKKGYDEGLANKLFDLVEPFAGYAFNKAHSVSYAMVSYWTAYMKTNHPLEYFSALLASYAGDSYRIGECIKQARQMGIEVLGPDVNKSQSNFAITELDGGKQGIIFGLSNIKHVGDSVAKALIATREEKGEFGSLADFTDRVHANYLTSGVLSGLIFSGALDRFGSRSDLNAREHNILARIKVATAQRDSGQTSMEDLFGEQVEPPRPALELDETDTERDPHADGLLLQWESQTLGIVVSKNLLNSIAAQSSGQQAMLETIRKSPTGTEFEVQGVVIERNFSKTRDGSQYLIAKLQMNDGDIDVVVWPDVLKETDAHWEMGKLVRVNGRSHEWQNVIRLTAQSLGDTNAPAKSSMLANESVQPADTQETPALLSEPQESRLNQQTRPRPPRLLAQMSRQHQPNRPHLNLRQSQHNQPNSPNKKPRQRQPQRMGAMTPNWSCVSKKNQRWTPAATLTNC